MTWTSRVNNCSARYTLVLLRKSLSVVALPRGPIVFALTKVLFTARAGAATTAVIRAILDLRALLVAS
jgi:hypothetical protein